MTIYKILKTNGVGFAILRDNNAFIPFDPANTDYQAYLAWIAEGNTPQPAEEGN